MEKLPEIFTEQEVMATGEYINKARMTREAWLYVDGNRALLGWCSLAIEPEAQAWWSNNLWRNVHDIMSELKANISKA